MITQQYYIGKTINSVELRFRQHINDANNYKDNSILHNAMRKYGYNNFVIEPIEEDIPNELLNQKEIYYISLFKSTKQYGNYNLTNGGDGGRTYSKLNENTFWILVDKLKDLENYPQIDLIADEFNVDASEIAKINQGIYWHQDNLEYPIRKTKQKRKDRGKWCGSKNPRARRVECIELNMIFDTITEANKYFGVKHSHISSCCSGNRNKALGYHWRYVN